jgi:hypothetical protein
MRDGTWDDGIAHNVNIEIFLLFPLKMNNNEREADEREREADERERARQDADPQLAQELDDDVEDALDAADARNRQNLIEWIVEEIHLRVSFTLHFIFWGRGQTRKLFTTRSSSHPPAGLASLAVGGLSPALCALSHTILFPPGYCLRLQWLRRVGIE